MKEVERHLNGLALNTQRRYKAVLKDFTGFTGKPLAATAESDIFEYLDYINTKDGIKARRGNARGLSGATIRNTLEVLSSAFNILLRRKLIAFNPVKFSGIRFPNAKKNQKRPTEILPFELVSKIVHSPDRKTKTGIRDRAILACLFGAGLRKSEAIKLTLDAVRIADKDTLYLYLHDTKSGSDKEQCLATWAAESVTRLIEQRMSEGAKPNSPFFVRYKGRKNIKLPIDRVLLPRMFDRIFKKYTAGLSTGTYSPHSARATAISYLWEKETDSRRIQEFARHADLKSTIVYDKRGLKDTARKLFYV